MPRKKHPKGQPSSQTLARRVNRTLVEAGFECCTALREAIESFRAENAEQIGQAGHVLSEGALETVDSTRYRPGTAPEVVFQKIAEAVAQTVLHLEYEAALKRTREDAQAERKLKRDGYFKAAIALEDADSRLAARLHRQSVFYGGLAKSWAGTMPRRVPRQPRPAGYRDMTASQHLNILTLNLLAILLHTTNLSTHHVLHKLAPEILTATLTFAEHPLSERGEPHPLKRYKDARERIVSQMHNLGDDKFTMEDDLFLRRCLLFAEDRRFPPNLFAPHRTTRTVPQH